MLEVIINSLYLLFGFLALYFQRSYVGQKKVAEISQATANIRQYALEYIVKAEKIYSDTKKAGVQKMDYAVDQIINQLPEDIRSAFPKEAIKTIVQSTFDYAEDFAIAQIDEVIEGNGL